MTASIRLPILTPLARDIGRDINIVFYLLAILLTGVVLAMKTWGLAALVMCALPVVPLMFTFFIYISLP